ncbi:Chaperone protein dnaJ 11, chloroplastic [Ananas comosus]|uniref:Chaperone protein dnaJ 11, chloroplastic n=1 Tax=Ananas comosus TaxID=4615 RepID=A0A199UYQ6_ANACO|nr:Chaperone protein dnaJ 11, chloroplastic [Ananas comosus]
MISPKFTPLRISPSPRSLSSPPSPLLSPRAAASSSLYDVLGVSGAATAAEIRAAYRRLALVSHPDASSSASAAAEFMRIHAAYATLSDPDERHAYDRRRLLLLRPRRPLPPPPPPPRPSSPAFARSPSFPGFHPRRRTWETDQCW